MKKEYKICIFAILVVLILVLNHVFGWSKYLLAQENMDLLKNMVNENILLASLIYIALTVVASVLLAVPGVTFAIIAGVLFGPWLGTLLCCLAATLGAVFSFLVGRFFLKDSIKRYSGKKLESKYENMIFVQGEKYQPSFADEEKEVFDIEVCKYPTTQKMWIEVMENNPSSYKGDNKPVDSVNWWQALEYCNKLSQKYGLEPVYDLSKKEQGILMIKELGGEIVYPDVANFKNTEGFRLPTEVEWEWFARGGKIAIEQGTFDYTYSGSNNINEVVWYRENTGVRSNYDWRTDQTYYVDGSSQDVGLKKPNQLGLFDCSGNIREWCYDTVGDIEDGKLYTYDAFDTSKQYRRVRGGSWYNPSDMSKVVYQDSTKSNDTFGNNGFRIVRTVQF